MASLLSLPPELIDILVQYLGPEDIVALSKLVPVRITRKVYKRAFNDDTEFTHYDIRMFEERTRAKLYIIGKADPFTRILGDNPEYMEHLRTAPKRARTTHWRMHSPLKVPCPGTVVQLGLSGNAVDVLMQDGRLYSSNLGYDKEPGHVTEVMRRVRLGGPIGEQSVQSWGPVLSSVAEFSERLYNRPAELDRLRWIESDRYRLALDDVGQLWWWPICEQSMRNPCQLVPLCMVDRKSRVITDRVLRVRADHVFAVQFEHRGLMHGQLQRNGYIDAWNGFRNRYPSMNGYCPAVVMTEIPDTAHARDFIEVQGVFIVLRQDGTLSAAGYMGNEPSVGFRKGVEKLNVYSPVSRLVKGDSARFGIIMENGLLLVVEALRYSVEAHVAPGLQRVEIAALAMRDTRCMALTRDGDVYVWGSEQYCTGELGLGTLEDALEKDSVEIEDFKRVRSLVVNWPTKLSLPGRVYAISLRNYLTAMLIYDGSE